MLCAAFVVLLFTFFKLLFFPKNSLRNTIRVSNRLEPDQAGHSVGPDLGPNCLQRLSEELVDSFLFLSNEISIFNLLM